MPRLSTLSSQLSALLLLTLLVSCQRSLPVTEPTRLVIPSGSSYEALTDSLDAHGLRPNKAVFNVTATLLRLPSRVHGGSYLIQPGTSTTALIRKISSGSQDPVRITINKHRTLPQLCQYLGDHLEFSADTLLAILSADTFCTRYGCTPAGAFLLFPRNTYEFYWTVSPRRFVERMQQESERFWTPRRDRCDALGLTPAQVLTLASIVEEETNCNDEKADIASVYLNRLRIGMALQADPTVRYALGDFSVRRIRGEMLQNPSPYNTYTHQGLPPGPICIPSTASIDAVLQGKQTSYLYFCAKEDFSGRHRFAATLAEHQINARRFHAALNKRGL